MFKINLYHFILLFAISLAIKNTKYFNFIRSYVYNFHNAYNTESLDRHMKYFSSRDFDNNS